MVGCLVRQSLETEENASPQNAQVRILAAVHTVCSWCQFNTSQGLTCKPFFGRYWMPYLRNQSEAILHQLQS